MISMCVYAVVVVCVMMCIFICLSLYYLLYYFLLVCIINSHQYLWGNHPLDYCHERKPGGKAPWFTKEEQILVLNERAYSYYEVDERKD